MTGQLHVQQLTKCVCHGLTPSKAMIPGEGLLPAADVRMTVLPVSAGAQLGDSSSGWDKEENAPHKTMMVAPGADWIGFIFLVLSKGKCCLSFDDHTSSTAQGGGGSFKNRKLIGEVGCCESRMAERIHWWIDRWLELCFLEWLQRLQWSPYHSCWM